MALTKKMLQAMEISDDKIEQILDAHGDTVKGLTDTRDTLQSELDKANAELKRLENVEKDLVKANAKLEEVSDMEQKYKALEKEYSDYKADVVEKTTKASKEKAYRDLLSKANISEKRHDSIIKVTDLNSVILDKDGNVKNSDELLKDIESEWSDFKVTETKQGANVANPPSNNGGSTFEKMSLAEKMAYANENPDNSEVRAWLK